MGEGKKRAVDIFTDAGGCNPGMPSSWAAVAVRIDGRGGIFEASGVLREEVDSFAGEARAIANGLYQTFAAGLIDRGDIVVIRCDNLEVVRAYSGKRKAKKPLRADVRDARALIRKFAAVRGFRLRFAHIGAHGDLSSGDPFVLFNARADFLCCRAIGVKREKQAERGVTDAQFATLSRQRAKSGALKRVRDTVARLTGR